MKKILIISSNRLGDSILSSGLNKFFKDKYFKVHLVCGPLPFNLFRFCSNIDKIISLKKKKYSVHWLYLWFKVFFNVWDYVIDLRGSAISFFLFTKRRIIYRSLISSQLHKTKSISSLVSERNLPPSINLVIPKNKKVKIKKLLKVKYKNLIMVAPCANWVGKTWPIERFIELLKKLKKEKEFSESLFVIIGAMEEKLKMKKLINDKSINLLDLVGKIDLVEMYFLMKKSNLFIGNDSGLMHLAALTKIPTIGLFGPSDLKKYRPFGVSTLAIKTFESYEELMSYKGFDHKKVSSLMTSLKVDYVFEKIMKFCKRLK